MLLAIIIVWVLAVAPVVFAACEPPPPSPWFVESVSVDGVSLPEGVALEPAGRGLDLINTTTTDLYVLGRAKPALQPYRTLGLDLPKGLVPIYRLLANRAFEWQGPKTDWQAMGPGPRMRLPFGFAPPDEDRLRLYTRDLETANRIGDGRPADVAIPAPQHSLLYLVYDKQLIAVPFTVSYALNPSYDPQSVARGEELCDPQKPLLRLCLLVTGVVVIAILAIMTSYRRGLRRPPRGGGVPSS